MRRLDSARREAVAAGRHEDAQRERIAPALVWQQPARPCSDSPHSTVDRSQGVPTMRDILVTLIVFGSLPLILRHPVNGALMWIWISVMNPHTQGWGFATDFPYAQI